MNNGINKRWLSYRGVWLVVAFIFVFIFFLLALAYQNITATLMTTPKWEDGLHMNAIDAAYGICPYKRTLCKMHTGASTTKLSTDNSLTIRERWCIEVIYQNTETDENGKAAVEVILTDRDDDNPSNWKVTETLYDNDCTAMR